MLGTSQVCGMLGILKLHRQAWVAPGDAEQGSRGQLQLPGVPNASWLVRDWRFEEDSVFRPLPVTWEAYIQVPGGLGSLTTLWERAMAVWVLSFQPKVVRTWSAQAQLVLRRGPASPEVTQGWNRTQAGVILQSWCRALLFLREKRKYFCAPAKCKN